MAGRDIPGFLSKLLNSTVALLLCKEIHRDHVIVNISKHPNGFNTTLHVLNGIFFCVVHRTRKQNLSRLETDTQPNEWSHMMRERIWFTLDVCSFFNSSFYSGWIFGCVCTSRRMSYIKKKNRSKKTMSSTNKILSWLARIWERIFGPLMELSVWLTYCLFNYTKYLWGLLLSTYMLIKFDIGTKPGRYTTEHPASSV